MPETMEELITLPGIARKSANVILYNVFGKNEGLAVDTHVIRLAQKLGLSEYNDPVKIEKDLMGLVPREEWGEFCNGLTLYGRYICKAIKHDCSNHELTKIYPEASSIWPVK
jgi:endonuclease-3